MKKVVVELRQHQITVLAALVLSLYVITFLVGYFWGKQSILGEFSEQITNESFSDKIYASLCTLNEQNSESNVQPAEESGKPETVQGQNPESVACADQKLFVAHLIGYGTQRQAQQYCQSLERRAVQAHVIPRTSITAQGKKRVWYQVATTPATYQETQQLVDRLAIEDRLAGVSIVEH